MRLPRTLAGSISVRWAGYRNAHEFGREPDSDGHPHVIDGGAAVINDPTQSSAMGCLSEKDGFDESKETEFCT